jgi:hypothetical protein
MYMGIETLAYSGDLGRVNRRKSAACSGASRPPKPGQSGHRSERSDATLVLDICQIFNF